MAQSRSLALSRQPRPGRGLAGTDLMMIGMVVIWGVNYSIIKLALRSLSPFAFNVVRFSLATGLMLVLLRARGESLRIARRDIPAMIVLALSGHGLYQIFFVSGLARTTASNSSLILASMPIFAALYAQLFGTERANRATWAGIVISFAGILLLMLGGGKELSLGSGTLTGDLLTLVAAMLWAGYVTISKPLLARYSPVKITTMLMLLGTPILLAVGLPSALAQDWRSVPPVAWGAILYSAVLSTVLAYTLWSVGIRRIGSTRTAIYSNVTPIAAIAAGWLLLGDRLQPAQAIGAAVVVCGLLLTRRGRISHQEPAPNASAQTHRETGESVVEANASTSRDPVGL